MRIGIFTDQYYPSVSGVVTSINMLYEGLEKLGHECFIFTSFDEKVLFDEQVKAKIEQKNVINFKARKYPFKALEEYRYTFTHKRYVKTIKNFNLDIMHVHTEFNIAKIAIKAAKKLNIPIVHTLHTSWKDYFGYVFPGLAKHASGFLLWFLKHVYTKPISRWSEIEIVPTEKVTHDLKLYGMKGEIRIVPTGLDLSRFNPDRFDKQTIEKLRNDLKLSDKYVYAFIGRTSHEKNIDSIIESFAKTFKENDEVRLLIVGGGPELDSLKELVNKLEITDKVVFTGMVEYDKVPLYYQLADIFVNASSTETQGLTYVEALSSGLPVLVRYDECIKDFIKDGVNAFVFANDDEFVGKMEESYKSKDSLDSIKKNTRDSVKKFSVEEYSKSCEQIYKDAIERYKSLEK